MTKPQYCRRTGLDLQMLSDLLGRRQHLDSERLVRPSPGVGYVRAAGVTVLREGQVLEAGRVEFEDLL